LLIVEDGAKGQVVGDIFGSLCDRREKRRATVAFVWCTRRVALCGVLGGYELCYAEN